MRRPVIAGNWKMNTNVEQGVELARLVADSTASISGISKIVCPPFVSLHAISQAVGGSDLLVGAQDAYHEDKGAFTGEVSISMLVGISTHVILGHSERRALFCQTDESVALTAIAAAAVGIKPIVCVGESLNVRRAGGALKTVRTQTRASLAGYSSWDKLIVAYEPLWAIGTGEAATPMQAQEVAAAIRAELGELAGASSESVPILYGGSVTAENIGPFVDRDDIDGALVGGASLKPDEFSKIIRLAASVSGV